MSYMASIFYENNSGCYFCIMMYYNAPLKHIRFLCEISKNITICQFLKFKSHKKVYNLKIFYILLNTPRRFKELTSKKYTRRHRYICVTLETARHESLLTVSMPLASYTGSFWSGVSYMYPT